MTDINYAQRVSSHKLNTYFIAEGDRDYHIRTQSVVPASPCCNCYSVAKAFTVTAVGMLYDRGLLTADTLLTDILFDLLPEEMDPKWHKVTLHHLLLHRVGFAHGMLDIDVEDASLFPSTDYLRTVLSTQLPYEPGTVYQYTDAAYYLLSRVVAKVSGCDLSDLMRPVLMDTMKFKEFAWSVCPQGYAMGATGLYLRTEDMLKLAILYLNEGVWKSRRIVSKKWVHIVLTKGYELKDLGNGWYGKGGMYGQMLMFHPQKGLAVACHSFEKRFSYKVLLAED